ncbi:MAG: tetratricopeptide repeat protein [Chitinophagales bacterium]
MIQRKKVCAYFICFLCYLYASLPIIATENNTKITVDDSLSLNTYIFKADSLLKIAQIDSAIFYTQKVVSVYQNEEKWNKYVNTLVYVGYKLYRFEELDEAIKILENAVVVGDKRLNNKDLGLSKAYHHLAIAYRKKGNYKQAIRCHLETIDGQMRRSNATNYDLGNAYYHFAITYYYQGNYKKAANFNRQALRILEQEYGETHSRLADVYDNMGMILMEQQYYKKAFNAYQKSLNITTNYLQKANVYTHLAMVHEKLNDFDKALAMSKQANDILEQFFEPTHPDCISNYETKALVYAKKGDYKSALTNNNIALKRHLKVKNKKHPVISKSYINIADIHTKQKDYINALKYYQQAIIALAPNFDETIFSKNPSLSHIISPAHLLEALNKKAATLIALHQSSSDIKYLEAALQTYEVAAQTTHHIYMFEEGLYYKKFKLENALVSYEKGIKTAFDLYKNKKQEKYLNIAFSLAEQRKRSFLLEAMRNDNIEKFADLPADFIEKEQQLKINRNFYRQKLLETQQLGDFADQNELKLLKQQVDKLEKALINWVAETKKKYPKYYALKYETKTISLENSKKQLAKLAENTALVSYIWTDSCRYALAISRTNSFFIPLSNKTTTKLPFEQFQASISNPDLARENSAKTYQQFTQSAHTLYQVLFEGIEKQLDKTITQIAIIPDNHLTYLPFEALLYEPATANEKYAALDYLLNKYKFVYDYTASDFFGKVTQKSNNPLQTFKGYNTTYEREKIMANYETAFLGQWKEEQNWQLKSGKQEVQLIAQLLDGELLLDEQTTEYQFKTDIENYSILHLALHTLLQDTQPLQSQILFHTHNSTQDDGQLYVKELYDMNVQANLSVFTALQQDDKLKNGHSLQHLTKALFYSGCPSVLLNLWRTEGNTSDFMLSVYRNLKKNKHLADAVFSAKKAMLLHKDEQKHHPYFWANTLVVGKPSLVKIAFDFQYYFSLLLVLILLSIGIFFYVKE